MLTPLGHAERELDLSLLTSQNRILAAIPQPDVTRLRAALVDVPLRVGQVLHRPDERIEFNYFPLSGIVSAIAGTPDDRLEVAMIGRDGLTGLSAVLGDETSPHECFVQIPGDALRAPAAELMRAFEESPAIRKTILRYARGYLIQLGQTALVNGRRTIEERLARWLVLCHDRLDGDEIHLTHERLSLMLGVTRPGVTIALNTLEGAKLIRSERGRITILDRPTLQEIAGATCLPPLGANL